MGRLGFNLVREKDAAKNVESGLQPPDAQQNERNEGAEIGELVAACERHRRTIRSLRLLSFCLSLMLISMAAYMILMQTQEYYKEQKKEEIPDITDPALREHAVGVLALEGNFRDVIGLRTLDLENCTKYTHDLEATRTDLERKLETERHEREQFARESESRHEELLKNFNALSTKHELLADQEKSQAVTLEQLRQERAELIQKLETSQRKLQRSASQLSVARSASTSAPSTTTTPAPQRPNIFDNEQFRKINDLVKDIETVGRLFGNVFDEII